MKMKKKHSLSKKVCLISLAVLLIVPFTGSIFVEGVSDWTNLPGYKVGEEIVPHVVTHTSKGIQIYSEKGQFDMTENVSGVIYNDPITSLDGFSVEFTIDKDADNCYQDQRRVVGLCRIRR